MNSVTYDHIDNQCNHQSKNNHGCNEPRDIPRVLKESFRPIGSGGGCGSGGGGYDDGDRCGVRQMTTVTCCRCYAVTGTNRKRRNSRFDV